MLVPKLWKTGIDGKSDKDYAGKEERGSVYKLLNKLELGSGA